MPYTSTRQHVTPKLVAIAGPLKGSVFPIAVEEFSIGRKASNSLCLEDSGVSRCHCTVQYRGEECVLKDMDSHNGTFVNGVPVRERILENSDELRIGKSVFVFVLSDEVPWEEELPAEESKFLTQSIVLRPEDSIYLEPTTLAKAMADSGTAANLTALLRITREITSICEVNDLKQRLVGLAVQVVTASEGAVFLHDDERNGTALRSIADQAFESGSSVLAKGNPTYLAVPLST